MRFSQAKRMITRPRLSPEGVRHVRLPVISDRRRSNDELALQQHVATWFNIAKKKIEQHLAGLTTHFFKRYPNRGQRRGGKLRKRIIIKPDDGDIIWNSQSTRVYGCERTEREDVTTDKDSRRRTRSLKQARCCGEATTRTESP